MTSHRFDGRLLLAACLTMFSLLGGAIADEPKPSDAATEADEAASAKKKNEVDRYEVPADASVDELLKFVHDLRTYRPPTREDAVMHQRNAAPATRQALERMRDRLRLNGSRLAESRRDDRVENFGAQTELVESHVAANNRSADRCIWRPAQFGGLRTRLVTGGT